MKKLPNRVKLLVSCADPTGKETKKSFPDTFKSNEWATKKEVLAAYKQASGHYFDEYASLFHREGCAFEQYCAISPDGKREIFEYNWFSPSTQKQKIRWRNSARKAAMLWARGGKKLARTISTTSYRTSEEK
jgi:hypothetical protein